MIALLVKRYEQLMEQAEVVKATTHLEEELYTSPSEQVDRVALLNWKVKAKSLLISTCGAESVQVAEFIAAEKGSSSGSTFRRMVAVFSAAKEDYEGGYLSSIRTLVQAEVFTTELEQASELLSKGFKVPAAVIAGTVLETAIRELCDRNTIVHAKLDKMNSDLAKAGVYTVLVQKRITALADIRNNAAHGHPEQFSSEDVSAMIPEIERFLAERLS